MSAAVPVVALSDGCKMPVVGLGTYARTATPGQYRQAVEDAISMGYRHIDTAACYGNEEEVGEGINNKIKDTTVARDQLFVTTKLWIDRHGEVIAALKESLKRLNLDYVDLYLIHWPIAVGSDGGDARVDFTSTWHKMEEARQMGLTRSIGVSNFNAEQLERLLKEATAPVVNQIEINPTLTQHALVDYCKSVGVTPVAYTPLGLLSEARPEYAHLDRIKGDERLTQLATKLGKTKAQIALRYLLQRDIAVIPKSFTPSRMRENIGLFDFTLTEADMQMMDGFNIHHRCVPATKFRHLTNYPFATSSCQ